MQINDKAKFISLGLVVLLLIPALFVGAGQGLVLGVKDNLSDSVDKNFQQSIGHGVQEKTEIKDDNLKQEEDLWQEAILIWNPNQVNNIETSNFPIGTKLEIKIGDNIYEKSVDAIKFESGKKIILSLNTKTYLSMNQKTSNSEPVLAQVKRSQS